MINRFQKGAAEEARRASQDLWARAESLTTLIDQKHAELKELNKDVDGASETLQGLLDQAAAMREEVAKLSLEIRSVKIENDHATAQVS